ncbi:SDR family oxidoreductase [Lysobacter korlensis]|uniref:SDR family oxidoreductase n=1 Tax=Lysobacter korlensis TaxID=553636 RepID=A0ABV6RTY0_9GAMM
MTDRVVVVTGATGSAGRAVCERLEREGFTVAAVGRDATRLDGVAAASRHVCDLTDLEAVGALRVAVRGEHGHVDGLVHLVGGWRGGSDPEGWDWLEPQLVTSLRYATLAFHDDLAASDAGRLAMVGSISASSPTWGNANYSALKAAAEAWVAAVASGWRRGGTAAAVTFVVKSLGDDATPVDAVAEAVARLWDRPAAEINGSRIPLLPTED